MRSYQRFPGLGKKHILASLCVAVLAGCSTPNKNPNATSAVYQRVQCGMSRKEVFALLGPPLRMQPTGDVEHCQSATWSIPHDAHGVGHWTVNFAGDTVAGVGSAFAGFYFSCSCGSHGSATVAQAKDQ